MSSICKHVPQWLDEDRDGLLKDDLARLLQEHLNGCSACRHAQRENEPLALFSSLTQGPLPPGVESYILGGLRVEEERVAGGMTTGNLWPAVASLAAAAALVLVWAIGGRTAEDPTAGSWLEAHAMNEVVTTVEDIDSPTAEVFAFSVPQAAGGRTEVIMIVDRSIDL